MDQQISPLTRVTRLVTGCGSAGFSGLTAVVVPSGLSRMVQCHRWTLAPVPATAG
jgi:hypothetical protein